MKKKHHLANLWNNFIIIWLQSKPYIKRVYASQRCRYSRPPTGTPVFASEDGVVEFVGENNGYGLMIQIDSNSNTFIYGHLSQINVYKGQYVKKRSTNRKGWKYWS